MTSSMLRTAAVGVMTPVLTTEAKYLHHYGYALRAVASTADHVGKPAYADHLRAKAYHLRTLAR